MRGWFRMEVMTSDTVYNRMPSEMPNIAVHESAAPEKRLCDRSLVDRYSAILWTTESRNPACAASPANPRIVNATVYSPNPCLVKILLRSHNDPNPESIDTPFWRKPAVDPARYLEIVLDIAFVSPHGYCPANNLPKFHEIAGYYVSGKCGQYIVVLFCSMRDKI
jgi:hypothetical protein